MGWDSELMIDGCLCGQWRKHAPAFPTLLFNAGDLDVTPESTEGDNVYGEGIVWSTCAGNALDNLRASGFGWDHLVRDYSECREFSIEFAMLAGMLGHTQYDALIQRMRLVSPADELQLLADRAFSEMRALVEAW